MPDPKDPDEIEPPNLLNLCQQIATLRRYHENCVTFYAGGPSADEKKRVRHEEFVKTLAAVANRICKKAKVKPPETPALQSVLLMASEIGLPESEARKFFFHFESNGWAINGRVKVKNWEARLRLWLEDSRGKAGGKSSADFGGGF
jgi:hypothetical protein